MLISNTTIFKNAEFFIIDEIKKSTTRAWKFMLETYSSLLYKTISVALKAFLKLESLTRSFLAFLFDPPQIINFISDFAFICTSKITTTLKKISTVFKFILLGELPKKIEKSIHKRNDIKKNGNKEKILAAKLEALTLIGKCCKIPKTIYKFVKLFFGEDSIPNFLKQFGKPFKKICFLFTAISLVVTKRAYDATSLFLDELKNSKYVEFMNQYKLMSPYPIESLSHDSLNSTLKAKVKAIKSDLTNNSQLLDKINYQINLFLLKKIKESCDSNPSLIEDHFRISFKKDESTFFSRLDRIHEKDKVKEGIKGLKSRLVYNINSDKFSIVNKIVILSVNILEIAQVLGIIFTPLFAIVDALAGITLFISEVNTCLEYRNQRQFIHTMEKLTALPEQPST